MLGGLAGQLSLPVVTGSDKKIENFKNFVLK